MPRFSRKVYIILSSIFLANAFLLFGTWLFHFYYYQLIEGRWEEASATKHLILELSLGTENTLATWYSSMLFLLVAVMSLICFFVHRNRSQDRKGKFTSYGWLMFFIIFALLSFDEIASMHERLGNLGILNPLGDEPPGWVYLLGIPIAVVGTLMLLFCRMLIKKAPWAAGFAIAGILLFLSVPFQEIIELQAWDAAPVRETWMRPVHFLLLEEGSEITGVFLMLLATTVYLKRISGGRAINNVLNLTRSLNKRKLLLWISAGCFFLAFPMVIIDQSRLLTAEGDIGIVRNWFPAATAFIGALFSIYVYFYKIKDSLPSRRNTYLVLALFCLFLSAYFGSDMYSHFHHLQEQWLKVIFSSLVFPAILILAYQRFIFNSNLSGRLRILLWATLLIISLGFSNSYSAGIAYAAFSVFMYSLCLRILSAEKVEGKSSRVQLVNPKT